MTPILGPNVGYVDLVNHETIELLKREQSGTSKFYPLRPSSAGKCTRELYYELQEYHGLAKYPKPLKSADTHRLLNLGHSVEWHVIKQFELAKDYFTMRYKQQVLSFAELKANNPKYAHRLEGSLDMVLWSEKHKCVMDVKSKKDGYDFRAKKFRWDSMNDKLRSMASVQPISDVAFWVDDLPAFLNELDDPFFEANFLQLNLYALSSFLVERGVDHAAITQYNKNDSRLREIRFRPSKKLHDMVIQKFQTVVNAVDSGDDTLATRDYEEGNFKCRYCDFSKTCWAKEKKTKGKKK
jgi:hypothetical protein